MKNELKYENDINFSCMTEQNSRSNIRTINVSRFVLLVLLFSNYTVGYAKPNRVDSLSVQMANVENLIEAEQQEISIIQKEVEVCEKSLRSIDEHVDRANEEVSNQIAASSHTIQAWGWIIAIIAIGATVLASIAGIWYARYINKMRNDITHLLSEAQDQLDLAEEASADIAEQQQRVSALHKEIAKSQDAVEDKLQELQKLYLDIQKNSRQIYESMKREETLSLLHRLEDVPEDVSTLHGLLLVRPLEDEDFEIIHRAYNKLVALNFEIYGITSVEQLRTKSQQFVQKEEAFMILFAQHFMGRAIVVPELRLKLQSMFVSLFQTYFFKNDAEKSTRDLKTGVATLEIELQSKIIADYILAMSKSRYDKFIELYKVLLNGLAEEQIKDIWDSVSKRKRDAFSFATSIKEILVNLNPQSPLLENIAAYIAKENLPVLGSQKK